MDQRARACQPTLRLRATFFMVLNLSLRICKMGQKTLTYPPPELLGPSSDSEQSLWLFLNKLTLIDIYRMPALRASGQHASNRTWQLE